MYEMFVSTLLILAIFVCTCRTRTAPETSPSHATEYHFGDFDYWRWGLGSLDWSKKCAKFNNSAVQTRVTGGNFAEPNMFPFQVGLLLLQAPKVYQCGGALISEHHVLTAAHCIYSTSSGKVFLGSVDFAVEKTSTAVYRVTWRDFYVHERYITHGRVDDIGMVYLAEAVPLSATVQTIPLARPSMTQSLLEAEIVRVSGWGVRSDTATSTNTKLYYVDAPVLPQQECACFYLPGLVQLQKHICADGSGGRGSCDGDSGGPLTFYYKNVTYLVGLTAFGSAGGCEIGFPSVYMRITSYLDWIKRRMSIKEY